MNKQPFKITNLLSVKNGRIFCLNGKLDFFLTITEIMQERYDFLVKVDFQDKSVLQQSFKTGLTAFEIFCAGRFYRNDIQIELWVDKIKEYVMVAYCSQSQRTIIKAHLDFADIEVREKDVRPLFEYLFSNPEILKPKEM